jgi:hypothetical protein
VRERAHGFLNAEPLPQDRLAVLVNRQGQGCAFVDTKRLPVLGWKRDLPFARDLQLKMLHGASPYLRHMALHTAIGKENQMASTLWASIIAEPWASNRSPHCERDMTAE